MNIAKLQKAVVAALEDIKARDIAVFPVSHLTQEFDRVIIASADSARQTRALASRVREKAKEAGARTCRAEGDDGGDWILIDLGDIVVHIMQPATRALYHLEELWNLPAPKPTRRPRPAPPEDSAGRAANKTPARAVRSRDAPAPRAAGAARAAAPAGAGSNKAPARPGTRRPAKGAAAAGRSASRQPAKRAAVSSAKRRAPPARKTTARPR